MANFNVDIGTRPLAAKVDTITAAVSTVNVSIGSMTKKIVEAEAAAAENISTNVTYGFYVMTRNQFLQKAIALENEVMTLMMQIQTWSKNLNQIQARMEKDYNMISRQYLKIFTNIDRNLSQAIKDLDRPVLEVVQSGRQKLTERRLDNAVKTATYGDDMLPIAQTMVLGRMKLKGNVLQSKIFELLKAGRILNRKMEKHLAKETIGDEGETIYFPVVLEESDSLIARDSSMMEIHMPNFPEGFGAEKGTVYSKVVDIRTNEDIWKEGSDSRDMIDNEFNKLTEYLPERKKEIMRKLMASSAWKELKE